MYILNVIKIVYTLGFLVFINERGHFLVVKVLKAKLNDI